MNFDTRQQILRDIATGISPSASTVEYGINEHEFRRRSESSFLAFRAKYPRATLAFSSGPEGLPGSPPVEIRRDGGPGSGPHAGYKRGPNKSAGGVATAPAVKVEETPAWITAKSAAPASYAKISTKKMLSKHAEYKAKVDAAAPGSKAAKLASAKLKKIQDELDHRGVDYPGKTSTTDTQVPTSTKPAQSYGELKARMLSAFHAAKSGKGSWAEHSALLKKVQNHPDDLGDDVPPISMQELSQIKIAPSLPVPPVASTATKAEKVAETTAPISTSKYTPEQKAAHHGKTVTIEENNATALLAAKKSAGLSDKAFLGYVDFGMKHGLKKKTEAELLYAQGKFEESSALMKKAKEHFAEATTHIKQLKTKKQQLEDEIIATAAVDIDLLPQTISQDEFASSKKTFSAKLDLSEKSALLKYSGESYQAINSSARHGDASHSAIKHMDSALAKSVLTTPMVTYRGSKSKNFDDLKPGDTFVDKGYASTSYKLSIANSFSTDVIMKITTPAGKAIAAIPSQHTHEAEFLLPRNTTFKVTHVEIGRVIGSPKKVIHVEVQ